MNLRKKRYQIIISIFLIAGIILTPFITVIYYRQYIETSYLDDLQINLTTDYSSLNASTWVVPSFQDEDFLFEVETYAKSNSTFYNNTEYSVDYYNLGTSDWYKANCTEWGEWGYSFNHLTDGAVDGAGVIHYGGYPSPPKTKEEAYNYMREYVINKTQTLNANKRPWIAFNGHYPFHHYSAEFGFDKIGSEIGENMESYQAMMAFNRGAARQYQLPWFVDFSAWYGPGITDFNDPGIWSEYSGPTHGHSLEMFRRAYYMGYMAGTSRLIAEGGAGNYFYRTGEIDPDGLMQLTPLGEIGQKFSHFSQSHPNRGIPYTPIALYIDEYHGTEGIEHPIFLVPHKAFNTIPYTKGDKMTYNILDAIFPGGWDDKGKEQCQLVNSEIGDSVDVILQNASADVLSSYPVILMSGEIYLDQGEQTRLIDYVEAGGTLIVNSAYFEQLNAELAARSDGHILHLKGSEKVKIIPYGNGGNFILFGKKFDSALVTPILRELMDIIYPFQIETTSAPGNDHGKWGSETDIQYLMNRNENGWILTLINNDGISKTHLDAAQIDFSQTKTIQLSLNRQFLQGQMQGYSLAKVENWVDGESLWNSGGDEFGNIEISLEPGDLAILEFQFV